MYLWSKTEDHQRTSLWSAIDCPIYPGHTHTAVTCPPHLYSRGNISHSWALDPSFPLDGSIKKCHSFYSENSGLLPHHLNSDFLWTGTQQLLLLCHWQEFHLCAQEDDDQDQRQRKGKFPFSTQTETKFNALFADKFRQNNSRCLWKLCSSIFLWVFWWELLPEH